MFGHDLNHTGYNPYETQLKPPLRLKWSFTTGSHIYNSSPAVVNGVVYVGSDDTKVYALDAATGALKWSYSTGSNVVSSPAVVNGVVYVGSGDSKVYALDANTGVQKWTYMTPSGVYSSPAVANGTVFFSGNDGKVYALYASSGAVKWSRTIGSQINSSPAVVDGVVYVGSDTGEIFALDANYPGTVMWSYDIRQGAGISSSPAVANGVVYFGGGSKVYALDAQTGALRWSYTTGRGINSSPAVANGVAYVGSTDGKLYALDAATGALRWSYMTGGGTYQTGSWIDSSPAVANGVVYFGSGDSKVYALDAQTGGLKWSYTTGGAVSYSPAVANGVVYVGSYDRKLYAFEGVPPPVSVEALPPYLASVTLSWTAPITWTGTAAGSYDVQYRDGASVAWTDLLTSTTSTSTTFTGQDGHTYYFRARSRTATGALGDWGEAVSTTVDLTAPTGSLSINYGASYVSQAGITLQPSASDTTSGVAQMQFSNDGSDWSAWQSYATTKSWALAGGDGAKTVYGRFKDTAGNVSTPYTATVILDTTPPSGSIVANSGATYAISSSVTLALSASDATSGVSQMQLSNDGSSWNAWEGSGTAKSWTLASGDGTKAVYGRFRDNAGNVSAVYSDTIILDSTPPTSAVTSLSPYTNTTSVAVGWSGSDALSGLSSYDIQYKDGGTGMWTGWITATAVLSSTFTGEDGHTYYFQSRARDVAGNVEAYPGGNGDTYTTVDLTPPTGSVSINGGALYATAVTVTLNLSATDTTSGVGQMAFSNDGSAWSDWQNYAASKTWSLAAGEGLKTVYARFRDNAGNASAVYSDTITLISAPSSGPILINGGALYTRVPTVTLALAPLANTNQMQFSDDGLSYASFEPFTTTRPYTLTAGDGLKAVWGQYKSTADVVSGPYSDTIILDTVAPSATVGSLAAYQTSASFPVAWSATDATSGPATYDLQYRDGPTGTWTDWITSTAALSATFTGAQDGRPYGFRARSADNAGNQGQYPAEAQAQTTVDTTPPTGSISSPAYASSTAITLTLAATDTFGVASMAFSSDGSTWGSWEPYTTTRPYTLASGDGQKTVYGRFRDNAGNYSSPYSATVVLDIVPPGQPFPDDGVSGASRNPTPTFSWAPVTDNLSGVTGYSWRVDSGSETYITTTTVTLPAQADGEHTFSVRALDRAGNYGSYGSHLFTINTAAPAPPDILQPQSPTAANKIIVSGVAGPRQTVKLYVNRAFFNETSSGSYGVWNFSNVPLSRQKNVLTATATDEFGLTSARSSPMVVIRVPSYHTPPADMASGVVAPSAGGTVTTTNNYMVIVPQGAITQSVKVVLTPLASQSAPTVFGKLDTDNYLDLTAVTVDTGDTVTGFQQPVTVTLSYDPAKLTVPESSLAMYYYDEALGQWVALPSLVDTVNHTVSAQTTHFTVFGVLASLSWRVYLPALSKSYSAGW